jgi:hypothetical protein
MLNLLNVISLPSTLPKPAYICTRMYLGSLKIKELSYVHAEGYSGGALKHGPFALLQEGTATHTGNCERENDREGQSEGERERESKEENGRVGGRARVEARESKGGRARVEAKEYARTRNHTYLCTRRHPCDPYYP